MYTITVVIDKPPRKVRSAGGASTGDRPQICSPGAHCRFHRSARRMVISVPTQCPHRQKRHLFLYVPHHFSSFGSAVYARASAAQSAPGTGKVKSLVIETISFPYPNGHLNFTPIRGGLSMTTVIIL